MAENKTHAESNVWMCILPIQQNGTDPSKVRMAELRLYSEIIENSRNFGKILKFFNNPGIKSESSHSYL